MQLSKPPKPKATRKRLKKEILSDDFKKRKIFWKNIAENFLWKIFHLTSLAWCVNCLGLVNARNRRGPSASHAGFITVQNVLRPLYKFCSPNFAYLLFSISV